MPAAGRGGWAAVGTGSWGFLVAATQMFKPPRMGIGEAGAQVECDVDPGTMKWNVGIPNETSF